LLAELLVARREMNLPPGQERGSAGFDMLSIEWLLIQDPTKEFARGQPAFPGQEHPGLGMFREVVEILYQACVRLELDGLVMHPSRFHIAVLGSPGSAFLDPAVEGRFLALQEALGTRDISAVSQLLEQMRIVRHDGSAIAWEASEFVTPLSKTLREYFSSTNYVATRDLAREQALQEGIKLGTL